MLTFCDREITSALWKQPGQQYLWAHSNVGLTFQGSVQFVQRGLLVQEGPSLVFVFILLLLSPPEQIDVTVVVGPNEHDSTVGGRRSNHVSVPYLDIIKNRN